MKVYVSIDEDYPVYYIYEEDKYKQDDALEVPEAFMKKYNRARNSWYKIQQEIHDLWLAKHPEPTTVEFAPKYGPTGY